jgi:hypothetical protein
MFVVSLSSHSLHQWWCLSLSEIFQGNFEFG